MMLIRAALCSTLGCSIYIGTMARIRGDTGPGHRSGDLYISYTEYYHGPGLASVGCCWSQVGGGATKETNWCQETFTTQRFSPFSAQHFLQYKYLPPDCLDRAHQN